MIAARLGEDGWCPECSERLIVEVDEDDETGDKRNRVWCENCSWDPDSPVRDISDLMKVEIEMNASE